MNDLPRYTGFSTACIKCGHIAASCRFCDSNTTETYPNGKQIKQEHIKRTCINCKFSWPEKVLDGLVNS